MTDFSRPYSRRWALYRVDPKTWADAERVAQSADGVGPLLSASVTASVGGMIQSGSMRLRGGGYPEGLYRLVMYATQGGHEQRHDFATLHCVSSTERGGVAEMRCMSTLYPASCMAVPVGEFVARGEDGAAYVATTLRRATGAPVSVDGGFEVTEHHVFDSDKTVLDAAWEVLDSAGWCMSIDGSGKIWVTGMPTDERSIVGVVGAEVGHEADMSAVPNRYRAMSGTLYAEYVNDSPDSPCSTKNVGMVRDARLDTSPVLIEGESLEGYCKRRLREMSVLRHVMSYDRDWMPGIGPYSLVRTADGLLRVESQQYGTDGTVSESSYREESLWR